MLVSHDLGSDVVLDQPNYNQYVRFLEVGETVRVSESGRGQYTTNVKVELKTVKEGRIREKIFVTAGANEKDKIEVSEFILKTHIAHFNHPQVLVTAQVLESTQGNPLLKTGVKMVSHEVEDESDWPGHSSH